MADIWRNEEKALKQLLIFGTGTFARLMHYYLDKYFECKPTAFVVDKPYVEGDSFDGLPLWDTETAVEKFSPAETGVILAVGYKGMNNVRTRMYEFFGTKGYELPNFIHPSVVSEAASIGNGNLILEGAVLSPFSRIGNGNILWNGCLVAHDVSVGSFNMLCGGSLMAGFSEVADNCFIGARAVVRDYAKVASYTFVGASCYINENTAEKSVYLPPKTKRLNGMESFDVL